MDAANPALFISNSRQPAALLLMLCSGFAGLGYQIVWTQQSALWLGHEAAAVLAVVAAFFGGMAVGAFACGRSIERSRSPARWYAACEFLIALWSLLLAIAMQPCSAWLLKITGALPTPLWQWSVAFCGTFLLLLPATAAMGATLPAMQRTIASIPAASPFLSTRNSGLSTKNSGLSTKNSIAALYACNTFGAVVGVIVIAFVLIPEFGLLRTTLICALLNLLCCITAVTLFKQRVVIVEKDIDIAQRQGVAKALLRFACTGLLGIGYEVLVVRVLSQIAEDTVYTFTILLAIYLVGSAVGAGIYQRWFSRTDLQNKSGKVLLADAHLFALVAGACLIGTATLWFADGVHAHIENIFGESMTSALTAEASIALFAFGLPTIAMGILFSHLSESLLAANINFGEALAANTLGAALAPLLFGVLIYPALGAKFSLLLICLAYMALIAWHQWLKAFVCVPIAAIAAIAVFSPPLCFIDVAEGGRIISYREGVSAAVAVLQDGNGVATLRINNRQQEGSSATLRVDGRQALLPLYLHAAPQRALFLGLGTGVTAAVAAAEPNLKVDAAELLPEVVSAAQYFSQVVDVSTARPNIVVADARRYVRTTDHFYDVIVADNFHPARSGSGSLYTIEHFEAVRDRLAPHGIFCQWLPLHQMDLPTLRSIVQSFLVAYPEGVAILASNSLETPVLGLIGHKNGERFEIAAVRQRLSSATSPERLSAFGIDDEFALLGSVVAGPSALRYFAGDAPVNTDDRPVVAYRAPRITYAPDSLPRDRLIGLLQQLSIDPREVIDPSDATATQRLVAYWLARNRFIALGRDVRPSSNAELMLAQIREPLLSVLRASPDFRPAYDPLLMMANSLLTINSHAARELLTELARIQPNRPEANVVLQRMIENN
ncbi:MAG: fused MFS/spermidine synthase [Spongiibacteraceae bacterium]